MKREASLIPASLAGLITLFSLTAIAFADGTPSDAGTLISMGPGAIVESPTERAMGEGVDAFYESMGLIRVVDPKAQAVWDRIQPVLKRSFSRTSFGLTVFERADADVMSAPGHIYISTGAVAKLTEGELAAVISHEFVHMMDSSMLKALQQAEDSGEKFPYSLTGPDDYGALLRGHYMWEGGVNPSLEETALYFGSSLLKEAGYKPSDLMGAWKKLSENPTVEFEDYIRLHGLQGPVLPYLQDQLSAFDEPGNELGTGSGQEGTGANDPKAAVEPWEIRDYSLKVSALAPPELKEGSLRLATDNPSNYGVSGGLINYQPLGEQYWRVRDIGGEYSQILDQRDNLFMQYADLDLSGDGAYATVTTQQDILVYGLKDRSSRWLGLGRESSVSPDSKSIAYTDGYSVFVKDAVTGNLSKRFDLEPKGMVSGLAWSPTGDRLVFVDNGNRKEYCILNILTGSSETLELSDPYLSRPMWLKEGLFFLVGGKTPCLWRKPESNGAAVPLALGIPDGMAIISAHGISSPEGPRFALVLGELAGNDVKTGLGLVGFNAGKPTFDRVDLGSGISGIGGALWNGPDELLVSVLPRAAKGDSK